MLSRLSSLQDLSVEAVVWRDGRIYTAGLTSQVSQWNSDTLMLQETVDSFGGPVWALAMSPDGTRLAAGCEDGCVKLFDVTATSIT
jgi:U3 small nucleolar RNA-associated protein 4